MDWPATAVHPDALFHYSEDPHIDGFVPHVPATNPGSPAHVWAIEARYAPVYWFPRACPRIAIWANVPEELDVLAARFGTASTRIQFARAEDRPWIDATVLHEYRLAPETFAPWPDAEGQWVADVEVRPTAIRRIERLVDAQAEAGVELRFVDDLQAIRLETLESGLPFSIVRLPAGG